jgi:hypothetical protein
MKLELTTWQRMMCVQALNGQVGHISMIRKALQLLEVLELSEAERAEVGMQEPAPGQWMWRDTARRWEVEVADRELAAFLRRAVEAFGQWPVGQGAEVVDLCRQLEIEEKEDER